MAIRQNTTEIRKSVPTYLPKKTVSKKFKEIVSFYQLYILLLPTFLYVLIFSYFPMYGVQIAFKSYNTSLGIWGSEWVGFKHFIRFIQFPLFWKMLKNTFSISVYSISTFPCAIIFALLINEIGNLKFKRAVQMISYAPHFISTVVLCGMVLLFLKSDTGIINNIIAFLGLERIEFMAVSRYFSSIYVWSGVWQGLGWGTITYCCIKII
jgi:putative aldouronate transport system permease protein